MNRSLSLILLGGVSLAAWPAQAQTLGYGDAGVAGSPDAGPSRRVEASAYVEAAQVLVADLDGGGFDDDVVTYTNIAIGGDVSVATRRAEAQASLRYDRRIEWDDEIGDADVVSGLARGAYQVVPGLLSVEAGALATRSRIDAGGAQPVNLVGDTDNVTQVYSLYAGPTLATSIGSLSVNAAYRLGYTRVEEDDALVLAPGEPFTDIFDESVSHSVTASIGQQPGALPFGWAIGGGYVREDADQLDQRFEDAFVRADVTVPVLPTLAVVGGIGYENLEISERDAVRDANGDPVIGADGRLVTDETSPRQLVFETDGLIWDVGVLWRPGRRTSLEARVGRRYDSTTYVGSASYVPSERLAFNATAYDVVTGFGSRLTDSLASLPTSFTSFRNPLSGELNGCVFGGADGLCFNDALQSVASSTFRTRGVTAQIATQAYGWSTGFAVGYNRRRFFASDTGPLAGQDQTVDENLFASLSVGRRLDERSGIGANVYANWLDSGQSVVDAFSLGANANYYRDITDRLSANAALGLETQDVEGLESEVTAAALLGLRYSF